MRKYAASLVLVSAVFLTGVSLQAADPPPATAKPKGIQAITKFSDERILSFVRPAWVDEVIPKIGDQVKADQILARQNDTEEKAALKSDRYKATEADPISKRAEEAVKAKDEEKLASLINSKAAAATEIQEQRLAVIVDKARIDNASATIVQDELKIEQDLAVIAKLTLRAPSDITGTWVVVPPANPNQTMLKVGEIADGSGSKCVRIVKVDLLWIDVSVPLVDATKLNVDDPAQVTFWDGHGAVGKVIYIHNIAEAASGTEVVRIEVPVSNVKIEKAGMTVFVTFPSITVAVKP